MDDKEKQVQKALGTFPTFVCSQCCEEFFIDEKFIYTSPDAVCRKLCKICVTAQLVCDMLLKPKRDMGQFTKEDE